MKRGAEKILHGHAVVDLCILVQIAHGCLRVPGDPACVWDELFCADFDQGTFPGTVLADDSYVLSFVECHFGIFKQPAFAEGVCQAGDFQ